MKFDSIENIRQAGFDGFVAVSKLQTSKCSEVPEEPGIYLVLRPSKTRPDFLGESTGGFFKEKNPTVEIETLEQNWVEDTVVLYIGQTSTLKTRLRTLCKFGQGKAIGHWGGRCMWQLRDSSDLLVCWKGTPDAVPKVVESELIQEFKAAYDKRPFANLAD